VSWTAKELEQGWWGDGGRSGAQVNPVCFSHPSDTLPPESVLGFYHNTCPSVRGC